MKTFVFHIHVIIVCSIRLVRGVFLVYKLGELFCGPGGLGLGASMAAAAGQDSKYSIKHIWATDYDKDSCRTYELNICRIHKCRVICKDIKQLDLSILPNVDVLTFGFPCNDFSVVGEQKGINGVFGPLYTYAVNAVRFFKPIWFVAENVSGLKNANEGKTFSLILDELSSSGYRIYPHLYKFEEYGIPQRRHRIIITGIRNDFDVTYLIPKPLHIEKITCKQALECPPISKKAANNELTMQSSRVVERLKYIKPGENAFTADMPDDLRLNVKGAKISQIYRRLDPDKPAYTITGSGGGGTHVYHWKENRALTNRERARLQTFPDNFIFYGSKESVRKQIGMAVPPKGAKIIFDSILNTFAGVKYEWVYPNIQYKSMIVR